MYHIKERRVIPIVALLWHIEFGSNDHHFPNSDWKVILNRELHIWIFIPCIPKVSFLNSWVSKNNYNYGSIFLTGFGLLRGPLFDPIKDFSHSCRWKKSIWSRNTSTHRLWVIVWSDVWDEMTGGMKWPIGWSYIWDEMTCEMKCPLRWSVLWMKCPLR